MTQEHHEDTHESDALGGAEVSFDQGDTEAIGDPAAASVAAEGEDLGAAPVEAPGAGETAAHATTEPLLGEPASTPYQSPAAAAERGAAQAENPPLIPIAGAFVGAFVAAKLLGRLSGGDDD